jgi:integrase
VEERKDQTNPRKGRGVKKPVPDKRDITPWTEGRLRKIQLALPPRQSIVIPLGGGLGLRQGEILGLSPDDIDREQMIVHFGNWHTSATDHCSSCLKAARPAPCRSHVDY